MDWKEITNDLYQKIKPTEGYIGTIVDGFSARKGKFSNIWIEFTMNEFEYEDPFYGVQKSTAPFKMFVDLMDMKGIQHIKFIHELQDLQVENAITNRVGAFSNSLHFTVPHLKFGKVENQFIDFEMKYSFTNSDSYARLDGSIQDHVGQSGIINQKLFIKELLIIQFNSMLVGDILSQLNSKIYDIANVYEAIDTGTSYPDRTQYRVPYNSIIPSDQK